VIAVGQANSCGLGSRRPMNGNLRANGKRTEPIKTGAQM